MGTERLYYHDSSLTSFTARVVAIRTVAGKPAVVLDRTAFYPTSGGQPNDRGTLGDLPVVDVVDGDEILHVVDGTPPAVGTIVTGAIDWTRRFDHMQQHSGQHLLSQAFERTIGARTTAFHLGTRTCSIDLDVATLTVEAVRAAERLANEIVQEDRPVTVHYVEPPDVARFGLRKPTERTGTIRVIEFVGFDASACGGTHVPHASVVGPIKVRRWERRGAETRVEFVCGWRALHDYDEKLALVQRLGEWLSVGEREVEAAVQRLLNQIEAQKDEIQALKGRILELEATGLLAAAERVPTGAGSLRVVCRAFPDRTPDELKRLATRITAAEPAVALLGSVGAKTVLVFAQTPGLPFAMDDLLKQVVAAVGGRGGGTHDLAQGGAPGAVPIDAALRDAAAAVAQAAAERQAVEPDAPRRA